MTRGPPLKPKPVHQAKLICEDGAVSPLCAKVPRRIDLRVASWTIRDEAVTCKRCLAELANKEGSR